MAETDVPGGTPPRERGPSDAEVFVAWRAGEEWAMEAIVSHHLSAVWAVALSVVRSPDEAEDVCQEAFIRSWDKRSQCRDPHSLRGWLLTITRTAALARIRRRKARVMVAVEESLPAPGPSPIRSAERESLRALLFDGIAELTEEQRTVLILRDVEGWPHEDIADHLGISGTMSRRHLSDARARMRDLLCDVTDELDFSE